MWVYIYSAAVHVLLLAGVQIQYRSSENCYPCVCRVHSDEKVIEVWQFHSVVVIRQAGQNSNSVVVGKDLFGFYFQAKSVIEGIQGRNSWRNLM